MSIIIFCTHPVVNLSQKADRENIRRYSLVIIIVLFLCTFMLLIYCLIPASASLHEVALSSTYYHLVYFEEFAPGMGVLGFPSLDLV